MAKGYPGRTRARKAYWRGILSARRRKAFNPYTQPRLRVLFDRGRANALLSPNLIPPPKVRGNRKPPQTRSAFGGGGFRQQSGGGGFRQQQPRGPWDPRPPQDQGPRLPRF